MRIPERKYEPEEIGEAKMEEKSVLASIEKEESKEIPRLKHEVQLRLTYL